MHKHKTRIIEAYEMLYSLLSNSGIAKGRSGRAQALPNAYCALPPSLQKDRDTLIEQSNFLLNQSVNIINYVNYI